MRCPYAARAVALLLALTAAGCSFFVQGPPGDYRPDTHGAPACNRCARGPLTLDVIGAMWGASFAALASGESFEDIRYARGYVAVSAVGAAIHIGAFLYGWSRTARCREAQDRFIVWAQIQVPAVPVLPPIDCEEVRLAAAREDDPQKRFELLRQIRARCDTAPPGATAPPPR